MYEQISHSVLNDILVRLEPEMKSKDLKHFYIRLGANFYAIYNLFQQLYGQRPDLNDQLYALVKTLALAYVARSASLKIWILSAKKSMTGSYTTLGGLCRVLQGIFRQFNWLAAAPILLARVRRQYATYHADFGMSSACE